MWTEIVFFNGSGLEERADSDTFFPQENDRQKGENREVLIAAWTRFSVGILVWLSRRFSTSGGVYISGSFPQDG